MKPENPPTAAAVRKFRATKGTPPDLREARDEAIRRIAYFLYVERGCVDGHETEDWLRAEALVSQEAAATAPRAKPARTIAKAAPAPAAAKRAPAKRKTAKPGSA